jgi:nitrite reductase (NO-forming)
VSSFHIIGEIFDNVYLEGGMGKNSAMGHNIQTTTVLPGGSSIVEFKADVPGKNILVDHALSRMNKGAWAYLEVTGDKSPNIFRKGPADGLLPDVLSSVAPSPSPSTSPSPTPSPTPHNH